ncbi:MAG: hypothetical protein HY290_33500 [Planctomycetia bacterium]|nr:hypothetical protein [Planctomycetia bacterium]
MPAVQPSYVGLDMLLAYNSAGPGLGPTWVVLNAKDVKRARSRTKADVSNRGSKRKLAEPALMEEEITFDMNSDETDAGYVFLRSAFDAGTAVEFAFANGPIGTAGTVATGGTANVVMTKIIMKVFSFEDDQPLDNGCDTSITIAPCKKTQTSPPTENTLIA